MNVVSPIRNKEMVSRVKSCAWKMGVKPGLYVELGLNTGLRCGDLIQLTVGEVRDRGCVIRREQKTGKQTEIKLHPAVRSSVSRAFPDAPGDTLIFQSDHPWATPGTPISRATAYRWVNDACRDAGMTEPAGTHTLRKTFGYWFYIKHRDIVALMNHFNHTSEAITLRYIGYTQDKLNKLTEEFLL